MEDSSEEASKISIRTSIVSYSESDEQLKSAISSVYKALEVSYEAGLIHSSEIVIVNNREDCDLKNQSEISSSIDLLNYKVNVVEGHGNIGYGRGQNLSLSDNPAVYHLFMNPDVELDKEALKIGIEFLEQNPHVGLISPLAFGPNGEKQYLCKRFPAVFTLLLRAIDSKKLRAVFADRLSQYEMRDLNESHPTVGIPIISGCFMLCRSDVITKLGGFDPRFFLYFEDFDLSLRASDLAQIAHLPSMRIKHAGGNAAKKGLLHILMFSRSAVRFYSKYRWRWLHQE